MTSIPCGPPKPRNAVWEVLCVLHTRPVSLDRGNLYALSRVKHGAPHDGLGQIEAPAAVREQRNAQALDAASAAKPAAYFARKGWRLPVMAMSSSRDSLRAPGAVSSTRRARRWPHRRWPALPCRRTLHPCAGTRPSRDCVGRQDARDDLLRFGWVLRRGVDGDESCLIYPREAAWRFEIEMLLAADPALALDTGGLASIAEVSPSTIRSWVGKKAVRPRWPVRS